ncbi:MAG: hypothetical protein IPL10_14580 [Bacteroidetes bacterium]|nr:hypothetical protein [Bacteroidota bacterium]
MNIIESEALELLEFYKIKKYVTELCYSNGAKQKASHISVFSDNENLTVELHRVDELKNTLSGNSFFPDIQFEDFEKKLPY